MDLDAARARLRRMVRPDDFPTLSPEDVEDLLQQAQRQDRNGTLPGDAGWEGAYDLNQAAAEGYRWKAGQVAGDGDFAADGASFDRASISKALLAQAKEYQARADSAQSSGSSDGAISSIRIRTGYAGGNGDEEWPWPGLPVANL